MQALSSLVVLALALSKPSSAELDFYGKPCTSESYDGSNLVQCDSEKNMYCSPKGICECTVDKGGVVYSYYQKKCIVVASAGNQFGCTDDIQCKLSSYGKNSRCNMDYDRCECHNENEKTVLVDNACFIQNPPQRLSRGFQGCSSDSDCKVSLGELSRCSGQSQCECYDTVSSGKQDTGIYQGKCYYKKLLMEFCSKDEECRTGNHKNAVCGQHPSYLPEEKVCQCPKNGKCDGSGGHSSYHAHSNSVIMIGITTVFMGILATKVISN